MIFFVLAVLLLSQHQVQAQELNCNFNDTRDEIGCVTFDVFEENSLVSSISDNEFGELYNVSFFEIPRKSETEFVPISVCKLLPEIEKMLIFGEKVEKIASSNFVGCERVTNLSVTGTKISWLFDDSFYQLVSLEFLDLSSNRLKILPMSLLDQNTNLTHFHAENNEIQIIELEFDENLALVDLSMNDCIDEKATDSMEINRLNINTRNLCTTSRQKQYERELNLRDKCELTSKHVSKS